MLKVELYEKVLRRTCKYGNDVLYKQFYVHGALYPEVLVQYSTVNGSEK